MLIPSSSVNTTPELRIFILTGFLRFFRRFSQINVGGDFARIPFLEDVPVSLASPFRRRVGCDTSDHAILCDQAHVPTKRSLLELSLQDALLAQNKLLAK